MRTGRRIVYLGAAALLAAAVAAAIGLARDGNVPPGRPVGRNLFSFIKPLDWPAPEPGGAPPAGPAQQARDIAAAQAEAQRLRAQGAAADDVDRMRAAVLPAETAERLARMDEAEANWNRRVKAYLVERGKVLDDFANLPAAERERALRQVRDSRFTLEEQALLAAYEASGVPRLVQEPAAALARNAAGPER